MKKVLTIALIIFILMAFYTVMAVEEKNIVDKDVTSNLIKEKDAVQKEIDKYIDRYGSESYGMVAYVLKQISFYSIAVCFFGIAVGAIMQYAIGTRRLDMKQRGSRMMMAFITLLVIAQVLPLIFALVVRGWGS